jgi:hypothetical protein
MIDFEPIELSRKEKCKSTYFELYSMKNHRNIKLFSQQCYYQALILEMNHIVRSYCERPCRISNPNNDALNIIDFIVEYTNTEFLEMQRMNYYGSNMIPPTIQQAFFGEEKWCHSHGYRYKIITLYESKNNNYYLHNIKYLYGLMRRINSPVYSKYVDLLIRSLYSRKAVSISSFMNENCLSAYEALLTVSFGIYRGIFSICLETVIITIDTEVQFALNESSI